MNPPIVAVFRGGSSAEREVSLGSGAAALASLRKSYAHVEDHDLYDQAISPSVGRETHVVFSTLHGVFGEDGGMQSRLERAGIDFVGCDAASSRLCFNKQESKNRAANAGVTVVPGEWVQRDDSGRALELFSSLGPKLVLKPNCQGSSIGIHLLDSAEELANVMVKSGPDGCVVETLIEGREFTVGVLDGEPLGVVEIIPKSGWFDYTNKYTKGNTEYVFPAKIDTAISSMLRRQAATVFAVCGCRDFARVDFMIGESGEPIFLEINTLPGLKETSLLPMSAQCLGIEFDALVRRMMTPAITRFSQRSRSLAESRSAT